MLKEIRKLQYFRFACHGYFHRKTCGWRDYCLPHYHIHLISAIHNSEDIMRLVSRDSFSVLEYATPEAENIIELRTLKVTNKQVFREFSKQQTSKFLENGQSNKQASVLRTLKATSKRVF